MRAGSASERKQSRDDSIIKTSSFNNDSIEGVGVRANRLTATNAGSKTFAVGQTADNSNDEDEKAIFAEETNIDDDKVLQQLLNEEDSSSQEEDNQIQDKSGDSDESIDEDEKAAILADLEASDSQDEEDVSENEDSEYSDAKSSETPRSREGSIGEISINSLANKSIDSDP